MDFRLPYPAFEGSLKRHYSALGNTNAAKIAAANAPTKPNKITTSSDVHSNVNSTLATLPTSAAKPALFHERVQRRQAKIKPHSVAGKQPIAEPPTIKAIIINSGISKCPRNASTTIANTIISSPPSPPPNSVNTPIACPFGYSGCLFAKWRYPIIASAIANSGSIMPHSFMPRS
ncbi:hypothetical protein GCWU000324_03019 [Kingella oralis ATCC 51147]|uniref:Uncharacterized protein n=1 Tax=Kingella oralis ATCC 51147 TaxID=629741 RepID=C4GMT3_9NEIS|nr:hypothetical protein GCWU000324_03019 [Kingella oralis ATCC 51147]